MYGGRARSANPDCPVTGARQTDARLAEPLGLSPSAFKPFGTLIERGIADVKSANELETPLAL